MHSNEAILPPSYKPVLAQLPLDTQHFKRVLGNLTGILESFNYEAEAIAVSRIDLDKAWGAYHELEDKLNKRQIALEQKEKELKEFEAFLLQREKSK